jgi:chemotaxis response regulator CheB
VKQALSLRPEVVVMDVNIPKANGVEATRLITGKVPQVRVVGLSVRDDEEVAAAMRQCGRGREGGGSSARGAGVTLQGQPAWDELRQKIVSVYKSRPQPERTKPARLFQ